MSRGAAEGPDVAYIPRRFGPAPNRHFQRHDFGRSRTTTTATESIGADVRPTLLAVALVLLLGTGCTSQREPSPAPSPDDQRALAEQTYDELPPRDRYAIEVSSLSPDAPDSFRGRPRLPSCGYAVHSFRQVPDPRVLECFRRAALPSSPGAEMVSLAWTVEGGPVISYQRVGPGIDGLETFIDASRDNDGAGRWLSFHEDLGRVARVGPPTAVRPAQAPS